MKKVMNSAIVYFILAMVSGVFYREFTKWWDFSGATTLSVLHTHLLILGTGVTLLLSFGFKKQQPKHFNRLFFGYNLSFSLMILTLLLRGIVQVMDLNLSAPLNASLSGGVAGLSHIAMAIFLGIFLFAIRKNYLNEIGGK